jgi:uncharacterized membrane protein
MGILIIALALLLRIGLNTNQSLWLDEATSVLTAKNLTSSQILTIFSPNDFHPPFYYLLLHLWVSIGGSGEFWARSLSSLCILLTGVVVYKIGQIIVGQKWAIVSAALFSTGPLVFYYAGEARMYALETLLTTAAFWSFLKKRWLVWTVSCGFLVYTDYMPYLVLPIFLLPIFQKGVSPVTRKKILLGLTALFILFIPWLPTFFHQLNLGARVQSETPGWNTVLGSLSLKTVPLLWVKLIIGRISFYNRILYTAIAAFASLIFGGLLYLSKNKITKTSPVGILWLWFTLPVVLGVILSLRLSVFQYFRFLFVAPAFYLLVTMGAKRVGKLAAPLVLCLNLIFISIFISNPRFYREDWRGAAGYITSNIKYPAIALFPNVGQSDPYRYYGQPAPVVDKSAWQNETPHQVWLFRYVQEIFDPEDLLPKQLESGGYRKIEEKSFNQVLVWRYEKVGGL